MNPANAEGAVTIKGLVFIPFPDGEDGLVVPEGQPFDHAEFQRISIDRRRCLNAIRAGLANQGWGIRSDRPGHWLLGNSGATSELNVGFPLSFLLRSQPWIPVVRRYLHGRGKPVKRCQLVIWSEQDLTELSSALYDAHLEREKEILASAVEIEPVDGEQELSEQFESECKRDRHAHLTQVRASRVNLASMETEFESILSRTRDRLMRGESLWLGLQPSWIHPSDTWVHRSELQQWARLQPIISAFYGGYASLRITNRQDCRNHIRELRAFLADEDSGYGADAPLDGMSFARSDSLIRKRLICPYSWRNYIHFPDEGECSPLYHGCATLGRLLATQPRHRLWKWLVSIADVVNDMGWWNACRVVDAESAASKQVAYACRRLLARKADKIGLAVRTEIVATLALVFQCEELALLIFEDPRLRRAALQTFMGNYFVLGNVCLALSLLRPGRECLSLIEEAYANMEAAYDHDRIDNTALALAIA